jgi:hypothetical protein
MPYVLGKFFVRLIIYKKFFFAGLSQDTNCFFRFIPKLKIAFQPEAAVPLQNIVTINPGKIAFGEAEIVNGIEQIGFANPIAAGDTNDPLSKLEGPAIIILELGQQQFIQSEH